MTDIIVYEERICTVKWGTFIILGLLALIFGILIFIYPEVTAAVLVMLFGVLIIVLALLALVAALMSPGGSGRPSLLLFAAILGFIVGAAALVAPQIFGAILTIIIAVVLFVIGIMNVALALSEKDYPHRWLVFLLGILSIIFAILIMIYPLIGSIIIFGYLIGLYFVIYGILSLIAGFALRSVQKEYCKV